MSQPQAIDSGENNVKTEGITEGESEFPRVYVGNLPFSATEEAVRNHVSSIGGEIVSVALPLKFGRRPAGYAFVAYKTEEAAKAVVEALNESELDGRKLQLALARSKAEQAERREAIVEKRNTEKAQRATEAKEKGEAVNGEAKEGEEKPKKKRPAKKTARRRQPGEEGEDADATAVDVEGAVTGEESEKPKRKPKAKKTPKEARIDQVEGEEASTEVKEKKPKEPKERKPKLELTGEASENTIFVSNLPFSVDDEALAAIFTELSIRVKSAKVIRGIRRAHGGKPFRASRGFGFVEVEDPSQQKEAVEKVEGSLIGDRKIGAKIAQEMKPIEQEEAGEAVKEEKADVPGVKVEA